MFDKISSRIDNEVDDADRSYTPPAEVKKPEKFQSEEKKSEVYSDKPAIGDEKPKKIDLEFFKDKSDSKLSKAELLKDHYTKKYIVNERDRTQQVLSCNYCPKTFSKICRLDEHLRKHLQDKPFQCEHCGKHFS